MKYVSTRDAAVEQDSATAVIEGVPLGGGLFVPSDIPALDYKTLTGKEYSERVNAVLKSFFDFDVSGITEKAYATFSGDPAPIVKLDDKLYVLELWHGRTCAFKDMALSVLPGLLASAKKSKKDKTHTLILVATSGDTGKAALEGFRDSENASVCVFYPTDGVSAVQKLAMMTQSGNNVRAVGITGNFDDAQTAVKNAFANTELVESLAKNGIALSSANSINIGRLVPQIAYYFSAYCDLVASGEISQGEKIDFVVPTGNFGNILAGYYARRMGLPVNYLVCASNRNNVLTDFIDTGCYDVNRQFYKTSSPSMDILVSSNLERLLYELADHDSERVAWRMAELKKSGRYTITPDEQEKLKSMFACGYADEDETVDAIAEMFDEYGYLIDTHTAVAYSVAKKRGFNRPTVVLSTANPYKFAPTVLDALGEDAPKKVTAKTLEKLCDATAMDIPKQLLDVFTAKPRFTDVIDAAGIADYIGQKYCKNFRKG